MRILLLSPKSNFPDVTPSWLRIPQLTLLILAGLTPPEHEVLTVEEEFEPLPLEEHWDAVRTLEFLFRNSVPSISPCILTPYPGTPLFERLMREGRILHTNWSYYDHTTVCYQSRLSEKLFLMFIYHSTRLCSIAGCTADLFRYEPCSPQDNESHGGAFSNLFPLVASAEKRANS
jgi:hypothetical protein